MKEEQPERMEEAMAARYWCHMCSQMVNPVMEIEIRCPFCHSGFIEEMSGSTRDNQEPDSEFASDRALSLWAPILLGMMGNPRRRRLRRVDFEGVDDENGDGEARHRGETELDRGLESIIRRRRRNSATILHLLQGMRNGVVASDSDISEGIRDRERNRERDREREHVDLINPFGQTIVMPYNSTTGQNQDRNPMGSLDDYFIGPSVDLLLQHLLENDPNRYGTPPAQKEAIEALPTVAVKESLQCSVCLDDFQIGSEAREMPCKHKFHHGCILPWLELHSSCPVCRYQLPADELKLDSERSRSSDNQRESGNAHGNNHNTHGSSVEEGDGEERNGSGRRFSLASLPWPFNNLFSSSSGFQIGGSDSSSSTDAPGSAPPHTNGN